MGGLFSKRFNPTKDVPDLSGKVMIVTGGNAGIGLATVRHLARSGAKVYLGARNEEKAKAAIEKLKQEGLGPKNGEVIWLKLDLSDPKKAKEAALEFLEKEKKLDVLVNNAAMTLEPYTKTHYDIQDVMVINVLSPIVFTNTLLPLMKETAKLEGADVRIVNVGSDAIQMSNKFRYRNKEDFNDEHAKAFYPSLTRYARSKLALLLWTRALQKRLTAENVPIITLCLHPGTVDTEGNRRHMRDEVGPVRRSIYKFLAATILLDSSKGATSSTFAASAPIVRAEADKYKGSYLNENGGFNKVPATGKDDALTEEFMGTAEALLKEIDV